MNFATFKAHRLATLHKEPYGDIRIPDLYEVWNIARPRTVLEIGCFRGVSTEFWALHCMHVVAVDPWPDDEVRHDFRQRVGNYPHVQIIEGYSPISIPDGLRFDLVYLDGDHSYDTVKREIAQYLPHATYWIGGHDYTGTPAPGDGVKKAVDEVLGKPHYRTSDNSWLRRIDQ